MAFFKFRARGQKGEDQAPTPAETIDDMRRRARHRLIGATVLVLIGVLGFPLLFDTQPRPIQVDIPIEIPDREKTRPLGAGGKIGTAEPAPAASAAAAAPVQDKVTADASLAAKEEVVADKSARHAPPKEDKQPAPEHRAEPKVERKVEAKAAASTPASADDGAKARALLDGKSPAAEGQERFILQVGAFADAEKARETRTKLERAGLKTYTQVVETKEGKRIRVRVGPYAQRAEADKAAAQIKSLSLPVSVLTL
ncbi:SPOR domain-containing protein [Pseudorhodoferax sp. Leaf267]|uniref:SPOR domain-containing protein n=1 Tax=Pseudorhodoferax sp. Leaf267 TaxID=1736316 RepID=UPI0006FB2D5F|nr:SPOR domain-containing protein [Pseudorhodoferax sp. Leaf267]KQP18071.1 hypothetical protein ASF43_09475 [Pseudorhodoferax sp. Leaf267]